MMVPVVGTELTQPVRVAGLAILCGYQFRQPSIYLEEDIRFERMTLITKGASFQD